ncbi:hypothetical protein PMAYCL1PPCAC_08394 [Pristionchus mayeri]|uniref:RING-type domain-containing protein n=1 Tax=Pristionchus mayeri TaxID=1317129 RepID=A0AAN4ZDX9_9BILA|nr:hypothetical protein PMAYCL1PPCAC_08394 [Pristionchus mayeri]
MQPHDDSVEECSICMIDIKAKLHFALQPCGHKFHYSCARKWMKLARFGGTGLGMINRAHCVERSPKRW